MFKKVIFCFVFSSSALLSMWLQECLEIIINNFNIYAVEEQLRDCLSRADFHKGQFTFAEKINCYNRLFKIYTINSEEYVLHLRKFDIPLKIDPCQHRGIFFQQTIVYMKYNEVTKLLNEITNTLQ